MANTTSTTKTIAAICIGNAMEWYDFIVYNLMVLFIAHSYFPHDKHITSLLATMASSGVAFLVRPLGGVFLAAWADKHGHHKALLLIFGLMTLAILLITFTPSYATIGVLATVVIVIARLLQGLATGGEFSIASTLLMSLAPEHKKGLYTSLQMVGQLIAILFGTSLCFVLSLYFNIETLYDYAWRIPFAIGLLILPIGWYLRRQLHKQFNWKQEPPPAKNFFPSIWLQKKNLLISLCLICGATASGYTLFSYMPTFSKIYLHLSLQDSFFGPAIGVAISLMLTPVFGNLSDKIGKKPILVGALSIYLLLIYPLLTLLNHEPNLTKLLIVEIISGIFIGAYFGVLTATVSELFPAEIRSTCLAISYNSAVMLFGGFAAFVITALIEHTHNPMVFTYYLMITVGLSCIATLLYQEPKPHQ